MFQWSKTKIVLITIASIFVIGGAAVFFVIKRSGNISIISNSLSVIEEAIKFLPIKQDTKKELEAINSLSQEIVKQDNVERKYLILLQNNMELRPGGGFLGQYAVANIKNGEVTSLFIEDANLLDQRITAKVTPPYPFERMMSIKKWKFRDSNFSPDFPINAEKAKYFYRLSGRSSDFDGVIAVNADVFDHVLELTGPITVPGYPGEYTSENATWKLEEVVEKKYLGDETLDTQNRKAIMKQMGAIIVDKLFKINNIPKLANFTLEELRNKNVMLNFENKELQKIVEDVHWDGRVAADWDGDYLMMVDANMGALKSDHYIKREIDYFVDLTMEKPTVTLNAKYTHTATYGDWRTSDYHSYLRVYVPQGSNLLERKMVSYPNIQEEFGKTYFGFILHVLINGETNVFVKYELPDRFKQEDYKLLIQKQSGVGDVPVKIRVKTNEGEFTHEEMLKKDLKLEFK
ncbi:MAG: DUF4012 domain-containing protein [Candidatus Moranbacteria bacterium]|nr:DUF4012 domain-containing protein [Candidatus Moranbacteria bacterium]